MPVDSRIPGINLQEGETVVFIAKPHWAVFLRLINILIIPLIIQYLRWQNESYVLTNKRFIEQYGLISKEQKIVDLGKIQDISVSIRGIFQRLMGLGVVSIKTAGTFSSVDLLGVPKPQDLADKISSQMDEFKKDEHMQLAKSIAKGMKEGSQA
jgi:uncharacterized membrane protein YdbT with pleckstrin-like domain